MGKTVEEIMDLRRRCIDGARDGLRGDTPIGLRATVGPMWGADGSLMTEEGQEIELWRDAGFDDDGPIKDA